MWQSAWKREVRLSGIWSVVALFAILLSIASCNKFVKPAEAQKTFRSPQEAESALMSAAQSGDQSTLIALFGPDSGSVLFTGDSVRDKITLDEFVAAYNQMHRWTKVKAGGQVLCVGDDNYPFPIPLGKDASGRWYFDTVTGKNEILARRIGKNELTAMDACRTIAGVEREATLLHDSK